jgi:hypothetical protein
MGVGSAMERKSVDVSGGPGEMSLDIRGHLP